MEEFVGSRWHQFLARRVARGYPDQVVRLSEIRSSLEPFARCILGPDVRLETSPNVKLPTYAGFWERLSGIQRKWSLPYRTHDEIGLPPTIDYFDSRHLNSRLYVWLVALASEINHSAEDFFKANQVATIRLLARSAYLEKLYQELSEAVLRERDDYEALPEDYALREMSIRAAIRSPDSVGWLRDARGVATPVALWIYPRVSAMTGKPQSSDLLSTGSAESTSETESENKYVTEAVESPRDDRGLMAFRLESLFSWSEYLSLDRGVNDLPDEDAADVVDDLDELSISENSSSMSKALRLDIDHKKHHEEVVVRDGWIYPEWDYRISGYRENFVSVQEKHCDVTEAREHDPALDLVASRLRKSLSGLKLSRSERTGYQSGVRLDIARFVRHKTRRASGAPALSSGLWTRKTAVRESIKCLVLADLSISTQSMVDATASVIDFIKDALIVFGGSLSGGADQFSLCGFSSKGRSKVGFVDIKRFTEPWSDEITSRVMSLTAGDYTRMGAAVRHAATRFSGAGPEQNMIIIITDGKPNDIDIYEGRYGVEDTRKAILEAKRAGVSVFCLAVDNSDPSYLRRIFGAGGYLCMSSPHKLMDMVPYVYHSLLADR